MNDTTALTVVELSELDKCETVINAGLKTFAEVGNALLAIRDGRLYREQHGTFEAYCQGRWGFARNYANKMITAAEVVGRLGTIVPKPATESQARPLAALPPEEQPKAWTAATEKAKAESRPVTARDVQAEVDKVKQAAIAAEEARYDKPETADERPQGKKAALIPTRIASAICALKTELELCAASGWKRCDKGEVLKDVKKLERLLK